MLFLVCNLSVTILLLIVALNICINPSDTFTSFVGGAACTEAAFLPIVLPEVFYTMQDTAPWLHKGYSISLYYKVTAKIKLSIIRVYNELSIVPQKDTSFNRT